MKFILWTTVWWGLQILNDLVSFGFGGAELKNKMYSTEALACSYITSFIIWILFYKLFVEN